MSKRSQMTSEIAHVHGLLQTVLRDLEILIDIGAYESVPLGTTKARRLATCLAHAAALVDSAHNSHVMLRNEIRRFGKMT